MATLAFPPILPGAGLPARMAETCSTDFPIDWGSFWPPCARCIRRWGRPPHWSARDWIEESEAAGIAAAWRAAGDFDPSRGIPLEAFARRRVLAAVLTRLRQEWSYAAHLRPSGPPAPVRRSEEDRPDPSSKLLFASLSRLAAPDRLLIEQLFWGGRSESAIARTLGISQQAVSKRKRAILAALRRSLLESDVGGAEFGL